MTLSCHMAVPKVLIVFVVPEATYCQPDVHYAAIEHAYMLPHSINEN